MNDLLESPVQENTLALQLDQHWDGLLADTSHDELSAGGQSLKELERLEAFEAFLATLPGLEVPTFHHFSDGVYARQINAPKDCVLIGHEHRHACFCIMLSGRVLTINNGEVSEFVGPCVMKSGAHTRKASIVIEDMIFITCHPNPDNERDISKLEERLLIKSPTFLRYEQSRKI